MFIKEQRANIFFWALLAGIYFAAWRLQDQLFLNWDVSYLLHAAKVLWAGGVYPRDIFTPNPPLILYLYLPPLLAQQKLGLNLVLAVRGYVFLLASLSLVVCSVLTSIIFRQEDQAERLMRAIFLLTLAVVLLILPLYDLGQREHLLVILTMPYLLLVAVRLQAYPVQAWLALLVGCMAGWALAMKPQFYFVPLLLEFYYIYSQKNVLAWLRMETLVILSIAGVYAMTLLLFYPDFIGIIVPYLLRNYYASISESWSSLLFNHLLLFCCLPLVWSVMVRPRNSYKKLSTLLALTLLGFLCSYLAQRTLFYYHLLPAFLLAILLQCWLFSAFVSQPTFSRRDYCGGLLLGVLGFALLFYRVKGVWWWLLVFATKAFFGFFALLFTLLLVIPPKQSAGRVVLSIALTLGVGFFCFFLAQRTSWSPHQLLITVMVLLVMFGLLAPRTRGGVSTNIAIAALGMLIFAYPVFFSYALYGRGQEYKENVLNNLIAFMQTQTQHHSIYVFSRKGYYGSPLVDYTGSQLAQRFDCLWPVLGFVRWPSTGAIYRKDKNLFIQMLADDLHVQQPDLVFVEKQDAKILQWDKHFNYLTFLLQNQYFRKEWQAYRYLTTLKKAPIYELDIYKRTTI